MLLHYIMYITAGLTIPHIWGASKTTSLAHWSRAIFFFILYKQIEELQNFRSWASENFEKRRALDTGMTQDYGSVPNFCQSICPKQTTMEEEWDFFQDFLQFYVYDLRFKAGGLTTFFFWVLNNDYGRYLKYFLMHDKGLFSLHNQYHGCWWPGSLHHQAISSHDIDLLFLEYSGFNIRIVNKYSIQLWPRHANYIPFITWIHIAWLAPSTICHQLSLNSAAIRN